MLFTLLLVALALWQKNILFAVFIVIAEVVVLMLGHTGPGTRLYAFTDEGLTIDNQLLRRFVEVNGFAFFDLGDRYVELILHPSKKLQTYAKVLVPRERVEDVKQFLSTRLHPFDYTPALADTMAKWLRL